jgi:L-lactate dehydrogenase complex protein LldE
LFPAAISAAERVLRQLDVEPQRMRPFCCGQVAFNEGLREEATNLAAIFLESCEPGTPIVVPSGSCTSMIRIFYRDLLAGNPKLMAKAEQLRPWVIEFSEFLVKSLGVKEIGARFPHRVVYHPACHLLRELGIASEPVQLLESVRDIKICELRDSTECCGFGGLFSVKFPHISAAMLDDKLECIRKSGAEVVVANDAGCLMQIGGGLSRKGIPIAVRHIAEVLASR